MTQQIAFEVLDALELPPGVVNLVNGGREIVEGILDHPGIDAVSFVGSAPVARIVYERAAAVRQARAGARRGQEPHGRDARRRDRQDRRRHHRLGVRRRRPALHGGLGRGHGRRGARQADAARCARPPSRCASATGSRRASTSARSSPSPRASASAPRSTTARPTARASSSTAAAAEGAGCFVGPTILDGVQPGSRCRRGGDLRPGALDHQRRHARRGDRAREPQPVRQRHVDLHGVRRVGPRATGTRSRRA